MSEYQYRVITPDGKEKKGTLEARTAEQASAILKSRKNVVLSIEQANLMSKDISLSFHKKITPRDFSIFCRQFVTIIGAGVSIIRALEMMGEQTENPSLQKAIKGICEEVSKGETLAGAMRKRPKVFPAMFCNMVEAGEASGSLEVSFERMAIQFEKDNELKQAVKKAMTYPCILLAVMTGVIVLMMVWVIPTFLGMFEQLDAELPSVTQFVLDISTFIRTKWWLIIAVIAAAVFLFRSYASSSVGKRTLSIIALRLPVYGNLQTKTECARMGRTLSTLLGSGVSMLDAIAITGRSMNNYQFKTAMENAKEQVMRGVSLSRPLKVCGLFPPMVVHMVSVGEETGNIEKMLENLAGYYEEDVKVATEQMMALMEPMIIVVMAIIVAVLILAIMQPMFTLYSAI